MIQQIKIASLSVVMILGALLTVALGVAIGDELSEGLGLQSVTASAFFSVMAPALVLFAYVFAIVRYVNKPSSSAKLSLPELAPDRIDSFEEQLRNNQDELQRTHDVYRTQSYYSFAAALGAQVTALIAIIAVVIFFDQSEQQQVTWLSAVVGIISEFISGGFYMLYRNAQQETNQIRLRLDETGERLQALAIIREIDDQGARERLYSGYVQKVLGLTEDVTLQDAMDGNGEPEINDAHLAGPERA